MEQITKYGVKAVVRQLVNCVKHLSRTCTQMFVALISLYRGKEVFFKTTGQLDQNCL